MSAVLSEVTQPNSTTRYMVDDSSMKFILVVEDDYALRQALEDTLSLASYSVITASSAEEAISILNQRKNILMVVSDINMGQLSGHDLLKHIRLSYSHIPVLLMTAYGSVRDSVDAIRNGAVDYLVKPFEPKELVDIVKRQLGGAIINDNDTPIAEDHYSQQLLQLSRRVAQSDSTVLIVGESGTGKEVLARYVHQHSPRREKSFVAINCAAIPENMLEAILFGYEKGAYTGAHTTTQGKFEQANGGTLLLDEISEMELNLQAKLLRVLQEQEVERLGGRKTIKLDVRVIATSNREMKEYVAQGKFREDLYYRLSVLPLVWKPLRERKLDILPLAKALLKKHTEKQKRSDLVISEAAQQALLQHDWPGNVRELDNIIQRALILQMGQCIEVNDLGLNLDTHFLEIESFSISTAPPEQDYETKNYSADYEHNKVTNRVDASDIELNHQQLGDNLQQKEFEIIAKTLQGENGSRKNTAQRLGISPRTLRYKLAKMRDLGYNL